MPIRVLVVDDDPDFQWLIGWAVQEGRDTEVVSVAEDGESGVAAALREQPDVVVMDLMMPRTDGFEATRRIKQSQPAVKVLAVTSWSIDTAMGQKLRRSGVDAVLSKRDIATALIPMICSLHETGSSSADSRFDAA